MSKLAVIALLGLMLATVYAVPATVDEVSESEKKVFQEAVSVEGKNSITPRKSIFFPKLASAQCWVCDFPCNGIYCCNDGFPQCCADSFNCYCCGK